MKKIFLISVSLLLLGNVSQALASHSSKSHHQVDASLGELKPIYFDEGSDQIKNISAIDENSAWLKNNPSKVIVLEGHCDERGDSEFNMRLGDRRARAVMTALLKKGVPENQLILISYGKDRPVVKEKTTDGLAENRRVSLVVR